MGAIISTFPFLLVRMCRESSLEFCKLLGAVFYLDLTPRTCHNTVGIRSASSKYTLPNFGESTSQRFFIFENIQILYSTRFLKDFIWDQVVFWRHITLHEGVVGS